MLDVQSTGPCLGLTRYVRCYVQWSGREKKVLSVEGVTARLEQSLEFHFETCWEIHREASTALYMAPLAAIIGPQTYRRHTVFARGPLETFAIIFQPTGFFRLFRIPLTEFTNDGTEASPVFGPVIMGLRERLGQINTFAERTRVAEEFLLDRLARIPDRDQFAGVASRLLEVDGCSRISEIASQTGLSLRQFERRFRLYAGVTPKLFTRIARFQAAFEQKKKHPCKSWMTVAHEGGYFDQMHLVRDFREFGGASPVRVSTEIPPEYMSALLEFPQEVK